MKRREGIEIKEGRARGDSITRGLKKKSKKRNKGRKGEKGCSKEGIAKGKGERRDRNKERN